MDYYVIYINGDGLQKSDPFKDVNMALKSAKIMRMMECVAWVEDQNHNIILELEVKA